MPGFSTEDLDRSFRVPLSTHLFGQLIHGWRRGSVCLGNLETWTLRERLQSVAIERPVFIAGLARSGTTILLEVLANHPQVVTHRYRDFPPVFTPYWWQEILRHGPQSPAPAIERAHRDGLLVGPDSPEAMEEPLWMAFFPSIHSIGENQVLDARTSHPAFENFYRDHVRKLLASRGGYRYVSKGNYNVARLQYLLKLFPDARFIIPVRHPRSHIASLMKQQRLFVEGETRHPRALDYMRCVGHFEFGLDRRAINTGQTATTLSVHNLWQRGEEVRGWARYWASLYGWLADQIETDPLLRQAAVVARFEDLCAHPREALERLLSHADLDGEGLSDAFADRIHAPNYYKPTFSADEELAIVEETESVARRFNYVDRPHEAIAEQPAIAQHF